MVLQTEELRVSDAHALRSTVTGFISEGYASYGFENSEKTLFDQAKVIRAISEKSLAAAFSLWSHRMTNEYLDRFGKSDAIKSWRSELELGTRLGSTALATALVDASGRGALPITFSQSGDDFIVNGFIPWASNLYSDTVIVFAARNEAGERYVFSASLDFEGFSYSIESELLEMNSTNSGSIKIENVKVGRENLLSESLADFLSVMRPRFLTLQTAFCLGVSSASLQSLEEAKGALAFSGDISDLRQQFRVLETTIESLGTKLSNRAEVVSVKPYLELRLASAVLAQQVTRLELAAIGGRAYSNHSETARRIHEALFFSVQAPTEGALRWELSQQS